jgi:hypothetical protein
LLSLEAAGVGHTHIPEGVVQVVIAHLLGHLVVVHLLKLH